MPRNQSKISLLPNLIRNGSRCKKSRHCSHQKSHIATTISQLIQVSRQYVYEDISQQVNSKTRDPFIVDEAHTMIKRIFDEFNESYAKVHTFISHCKPIPEENLAQIQASINDHMCIYRGPFPRKVIHKQHFLEYSVSFIRQTW